MPVVIVFDAAPGAFKFQFQAFNNGFYGGVRVAVGQLNGLPIIIAGAGPQIDGFPLVRVFSGVDGSPIAQILVFDAPFKGGVFVAAGDLDGDGNSEIVVGAGAFATGFPLVNIFSATGQPLSPYLQAFDPSFKGGVTVAVGDVRGVGRPDIVVGAGPGGAPLVQLLDGRSFARLGAALHAFDDSFVGGVIVAAGRLDNSGADRIVAGSGPENDLAARPMLREFDGRTGTAVTDNVPVFDPTFHGGVRVAVGSGLLGKGPGVLAAAGVGGKAPVQALDAAFVVLGTFPAFDGGSFVAAD